MQGPVLDPKTSTTCEIMNRMSARLHERVDGAGGHIRSRDVHGEPRNPAGMTGLFFVVLSIPLLFSSPYKIKKDSLSTWTGI